MQPVRELHQDHAHVLRHGHQHLADVLGLGLLLAAEGDLVQLGDTGDELAHGGAETALEILDRQVGVFHGVMEDGRRQRVPIELELGEDGRNTQRMLDELLARETVLVVVGAGRRFVGARKELDVLGRKIADSGQQVSELH